MSDCTHSMFDSCDNCEGEDDGPTCASCHSAVSVTPGFEWEKGEVCHDCIYNQCDDLRAAGQALVDALELADSETRSLHQVKVALEGWKKVSGR